MAKNTEKKKEIKTSNGRREELLKVFENISTEKRKLVTALIDEAVYLEERLKEAEQYPIFETHEGNLTPLQAVKVYQALNTQYLLVVKSLNGFLKNQDTTSSSPLQDYFKNKSKE